MRVLAVAAIVLITSLAVPAFAEADPDKAAANKKPRDVFIYFIHEAKIRAPAAAMALIETLK